MNLPKRWARGLTATVSVVGVGVAAVAFSGSASAATSTATLTRGPLGLTYTAAPGQTNHLVLHRTSTSVPSDAFGAHEYTFRIDDTVPIKVDPALADDCAHPSAGDLTLVVCTYVYESGQDPRTMADFKLGDQNDVVKFRDNSEDSYNNIRFELGAGADTFTAADDLVNGSYVVAGPGNDRVAAGHLEGDLAGVLGGTGNDTIRVWGGSPTLGVQGGVGNDKLYGGTGNQRLFGGNGNDLIHGGDGKDTIVGGAGNDTLYGDAGMDRIEGNSGNDKLYGGLGPDTLSGGTGKDLIKKNK